MGSYHYWPSASVYRAQHVKRTPHCGSLTCLTAFPTRITFPDKNRPSLLPIKDVIDHSLCRKGMYCDCRATAHHPAVPQPRFQRSARAGASSGCGRRLSTTRRRCFVIHVCLSLKPPAYAPPVAVTELPSGAVGAERLTCLTCIHSGDCPVPR